MRGADGEQHLAARRLLLHRKAVSGTLQLRLAWQCHGAGYAAYREYIRSFKQWNTAHPSAIASFNDAAVDAAADTGAPAVQRPASPPLLPLTSSRQDTCSEEDVGLASTGQDVSGSPSAALLEPLNTSEPAYSFSGMYTLFDQCKAAVNVVKFGKLSSELLAYGAADGSLHICLLAEPAALLHDLRGHTKEVTDLDWSLGNHYVCSSSADGSIRVWKVDGGSCLRIVYGTVPQLCIRFHPVNNNFLLVGNANQEVSVINFSTGRVLHHLQLAHSITAMDVEPGGHIIFAGDAQGGLHSIVVDTHSGVLRHAHATHEGLSNPHHQTQRTITSVHFRTHSLLAGGAVLLAAEVGGALRFFSVAVEVGGYLSLKCSLQLPRRARNIRASFCPALSLSNGEFVVTGNEDSTVAFYDLTRLRHPCGHTAPVVDVAWNHGETLLASSDCSGLVIVWRRAKLTERASRGKQQKAYDQPRGVHSSTLPVTLAKPFRTPCVCGRQWPRRGQAQ
eukprot:SM000053S17480  [mRNA]  locus=s53:658233:662868:+ [translate_table: standard]